MPATPVLAANVTITARDINNNNVAKVFNNVKYMNVDYYDGTINIVDGTQGSFYFALGPATVFTVVIAGNVHTITIS